jgi:peroxiredoxin
LNTRKSNYARKALITACVLGLLWLLACGALYGIMRRPPETFARVMAKVPGPVAFLVLPFETLWTHARAGGLQVGDPAPDFSLMKLDKSSQVQLSVLTAQHKPVVLVFGSYTWPPFRREVPALNQLYKQYGSEVAFLVVYITEAHPSDVWQMESNIKDKVVFASPRSENERAVVAGSCVRKLGIEIPAVLDEFGNSTESAYTAWPDRLFLIDAAGRVAYKSRPGPFGFKSDELKAAIAKVVSAH